MRQTDTADGNNAGCEVILMISFVICHDKQAGGGGGGMVRECQKDEGGVRRKKHDKPLGVKADKQVTTAAVA